MLLNTINITKFNSESWVLSTPNGRNILLNYHSYQMVIALQQNTNMEDAVEAFNKNTQAGLTATEFDELVKQKLGGYEVLLHDTVETKARPANYVKFKLPLISSKISGIMATVFKPLFTPAVFWVVLSIMAVAAVYFVFNGPAINFSGVNYTMVIVLMAITLLVHELGHIGACRKFNIKHGGIGIGVYIVFPVAYADISSLWTATKKQRIIANLGGVFTEYLYAFVLLGLFYYTNNATFLLTFTILVTKAFFELNPFIRMDGYWVLSDITETPNLLQKANQQLAAVVSLKKQTLTYKNALLTLYGLVNYAFIIMYFSYMLQNRWADVVHFPMLVVQLLQKLFTLSIGFADLNYQYLIVLLFYYLIIRYAISLIKWIIEKKNNYRFSLAKP